MHASIDVLEQIKKPAESKTPNELQIPYVIDLRSPTGKQLYFFGSKHLTDPDEPIFPSLLEALTEFEPDVILVGDSKPQEAAQTAKFEDQLRQQSTEQVIATRSDIGFIIKYAIERNIPWQPLEPTDLVLYEYLAEQGYSLDEIFVWKVMQMLIQYQKAPRSESADQYLLKELTRMKQLPLWADHSLGLDHFLIICEGIYGKKTTISELLAARDLQSYAYPNNKPPGAAEQSIVNKIWESAWHFRDIHSVNMIAQNLYSNQKVFVLYGFSHALAQEPALRAYISELNG